MYYINSFPYVFEGQLKIRATVCNICDKYHLISNNWLKLSVYSLKVGNFDPWKPVLWWFLYNYEYTADNADIKDKFSCKHRCEVVIDLYQVYEIM